MKLPESGSGPDAAATWEIELVVYSSARRITCTGQLRVNGAIAWRY